MRRVELSKHIIEQSAQVIPVSHIWQELCVVIFLGFPVYAVEVHIIEVLVHKAPCLIEHLLKLIHNVLLNIFLHSHLNASHLVKVNLVDVSTAHSIKILV